MDVDGLDHACGDEITLRSAPRYSLFKLPLLRTIQSDAVVTSDTLLKLVLMMSW